MTDKKRAKTQPTPEHLAALALGRTEGRAVREYLNALATQGKKARGRAPRSAADIQADIAASTDPVERLKLRPLLRAALERESAGSDQDFEAMEDAFVKVAGSYSQRQGLTYVDWRAEGVPAAVLKRAGVSRAQ
jgi:hypothetical protein